MDLRNKRILITGASSGIGRGLTEELLKTEGVKIAAVARNIAPLEDVASERLFPLSFDISVPENADAALDDAIRLMGGLDCVIACAGFAYYERFENRGYDHIRKIFETNALSPLYMLERLMAKTEGKISFVVISSALGKLGLPGYALYCSTKFALAGFADSFRFETRDRLHFMTVYPIGARTNFWNRVIRDEAPLPKPLQSPDAVVRAVMRGLRKEKRRVYTSVPFRIAWTLNRVFPFLVWGYQRYHKSLFEKWDERSGDGR